MGNSQQGSPRRDIGFARVQLTRFGQAANFVLSPFGEVALELIDRLLGADHRCTTLRSVIFGQVAAPATGTKIRFGAHIGPWASDYRSQPHYQGLDRNALVNEFVDAGVARLLHSRGPGM